MQLEAVLTERLTQQGQSEEGGDGDTTVRSARGRGLTAPALTPKEVARNLRLSESERPHSPRCLCQGLIASQVSKAYHPPKHKSPTLKGLPAAAWNQAQEVT